MVLSRRFGSTGTNTVLLSHEVHYIYLRSRETNSNILPFHSMARRHRRVVSDSDSEENPQDGPSNSKSPRAPRTTRPPRRAHRRRKSKDLDDNREVFDLSDSQSSSKGPIGLCPESQIAE